MLKALYSVLAMLAFCSWAHGQQCTGALNPPGAGGDFVICPGNNTSVTNISVQQGTCGVIISG